MMMMMIPECLISTWEKSLSHIPLSPLELWLTRVLVTGEMVWRRERRPGFWSSSCWSSWPRCCGECVCCWWTRHCHPRTSETELPETKQDYHQDYEDSDDSEDMINDTCVLRDWHFIVDVEEDSPLQPQAEDILIFPTLDISWIFLCWFNISRPVSMSLFFWYLLLNWSRPPWLLTPDLQLNNSWFWNCVLWKCERSSSECVLSANISTQAVLYTVHNLIHATSTD